MTTIYLSALRHSAFYSPYLMTIAGGFLRDEGLAPHYEPVTSDDPLEKKFKEGRCHVAQSAVAASFAALERGEEPRLVHFAQINERDGFFLAAREPLPDFKWSDLAGKEVLVDHFFQPLAMLRYGLQRQGVEWSSLKVIDAGSVEQIEQAFRAGQGDFVHMQGPVPQQLEADGEGHVVAAVGDAVGPVAFSSLCAKRKWLQSDMAQAFMRAYKRARAFTLSAPADEIAAKEQEAGFFTEIDRQVLAETVSAYQQLGCWQPEIEISRESYENLLDVFEYNQLITRRHAYESCVASLG